MRIPVLIAAAICVASAAEAQFRNIKIPRCAATDSTLGTKGDFTSGRVRSLYNKDRDSTWLSTAKDAGPDEISFFAKLEGKHTPFMIPAQAAVLMRGTVAAQFDAGGSRSVPASLIADDSVTVDLGYGLVGLMLVPKGAPLTVPVTVGLSPAGLLALAKSRKAELQIANVRLQIAGDDRRDASALYAALACGLP